MKTQLCDSHDRELGRKLNEFRRGSNTTQRHLFSRDVVEVQASLAHCNIHSLITYQPERGEASEVFRPLCTPGRFPRS